MLQIFLCGASRFVCEIVFELFAKKSFEPSTPTAEKK